jgi:hypothetical protein
MHYMVSQAAYEHDYEQLHNSHLALQDRMCHPNVFLTGMQMPENSRKLSTRKLMVTLTTTIGSSSHVQKYQKTLRLCPQYGQCNAREIS